MTSSCVLLMTTITGHSHSYVDSSPNYSSNKFDSLGWDNELTKRSEDGHVMPFIPVNINLITNIPKIASYNQFVTDINNVIQASLETKKSRVVKIPPDGVEFLMADKKLQIRPNRHETLSCWRKTFWIKGPLGRGPVDSFYKGPVIRKALPYHDVLMHSA